VIDKTVDIFDGVVKKESPKKKATKKVSSKKTKKSKK
jgi:hypothetical protein